MILARSLYDCSTPLFLLDPRDRWSRELLTKENYEVCCEGFDKPWMLYPEPTAILIDTRLADGLDFLIASARSRGIPVISLHDLGLNPLPSDIVIDGSIAPGSFQNAVSRHAEVFRGADYMVLDPAFQRLHEKRRRLPKKIRSVFINLGGGNSQAFFPAILEGLKLWDQKVAVVGIRGFVRWGQDRLERMDWSPVCFRWESESPYPGLMNADLAITAGGLSAYEALCAGAPLLAISYDPHQRTAVRAMASAGACIDLGPGEDLGPIRLSETLARLDADRDERARISQNGKRIVDGGGAERVSNIVRNLIRGRAMAS